MKFIYLNVFPIFADEAKALCGTEHQQESKGKQRFGCSHVYEN